MDVGAPTVGTPEVSDSPIWARPARIGVALAFTAAIALPVWLAFSNRNRIIDSSIEGQAQATIAPAAPERSDGSGAGPGPGTEDEDEDGETERSTGDTDDEVTADTAPDGDQADSGPSAPGRSSGSVTSTTSAETTRRTTSTVDRTSSTSISTTSTTRPSSTTVESTAPATSSTTGAPTTTATAAPTTASTTVPTSQPSTTPVTATSTTAPTTRPTTPPPTKPPTTVSIPTGNLVSGGGFERPRVADGGWANVVDPDWRSSAGGIEIWATGHSDVPSLRGRQHMELNGGGPDAISQTIQVVPELTYRWSFGHRGRGDANTVEVLINGRAVGRFTTAPGSWRRLEGLIDVPAGQHQLRLQLRAVDGGSSGNLIDDVRLVAIG